MDYTQLMYEAAERAYAEIGERHGYTGLCYGLAAVLRDLGVDVTFREVSNRWHDPLAGYGDEFSRSLSFPELVRRLDAQWFGHGTGGFRELPYPWNDLSRVLRSTREDPLDLRYVEQQVSAEIKRRKLRRGTRAYKEWVAENAPLVISEVRKIAERSTSALIQEYEQASAKPTVMASEADQALSRLTEDAEIRRLLLQASHQTASSSALTWAEFEKRTEAWSRASRYLTSHVDHLSNRAAQARNPSFPEERARAALEGSQVLRPFLEASGAA
jgi:hypothetical protein